MTIEECVKDIGNYYGTFTVSETGTLLIDNREKVFEYATPLEAAQDWIGTIMEDNSDSDWSKEAVFLLTNGVKVKGVLPKMMNGEQFFSAVYSEKVNGKWVMRSGGYFRNPIEAYRKKNELNEIMKKVRPKENQKKPRREER